MILRFSLIAVLLGLSVAQANTVSLLSNSTVFDAAQFNSLGDNVLITPHLAWNPNGPDSGYWVSYAETGYNGLVPSSVGDPIVLPDPNPPTAVFFHTFSLPYDDNSGILKVWADDTARVWMDDLLLIDANPAMAYYCTGAVIGCMAPDGLAFDLGAIGLPAGDHTLKIEAYQRYGWSFGVQYAASIESTELVQPESLDTPEPATVWIFIPSLAALWFWRRRVWRAE